MPAQPRSRNPLLDRVRTHEDRASHLLERFSAEAPNVEDESDLEDQARMIVALTLAALVFDMGNRRRSPTVARGQMVASRVVALIRDVSRRRGV